MVVLASRSETHVAAAVRALRDEGLEVSEVRCDTRELDDVEALRDHAQQRGRLDIWVNNAGVAGVYGPTASTPVDDFERVIRTNIVGTFHGARVALPVFLEQGSGDLVNLWGQGDNGPVAMQNAYASSKRWVRQFTETLQRETKGTPVRVHGMNPGLVMTDLLGHVTAQAGYERRLAALPIVVALWGQTPAVAARPIVGLVTSRRPVYRDLSGAGLVVRGLRNALSGRLREENRMALEVTTVPRQERLPVR